MVAFVLSLLTAHIALATSLTFKLRAQERECFYVSSARFNEKIGFYFAVQSGGDFDIDYEIIAPNDQVILQDFKEKNIDIEFAASRIGDYEFCFSNRLSSFHDKVIDFDIASESEYALISGSFAEFGIFPSNQTEKGVEEIKKSGEGIASKLQNIRNSFDALTRKLKYFRTNENRHFDILKHIESRFFWFIVCQNVLIFATVGLQLFLIQMAFSAKSRLY